MSTPRELLEEAGATLTRAEALIARAGEELGEPFESPLKYLAADAARLRRKLRNATTTTTASGAGDHG